MDSANWWYERDCDTLVRQGLLVRRLHRCRTAHQEVEILEHDRLGRILILDGILQTTQTDEFIYHEMISHPGLLGRSAAGGSSDRSPVAVLIIGGGDGGTLREVLVHPWVTRVVMVEVDGDVVEICKEHLGIHGDYTDPRVTLRIEDGAAYVQSAQARQDPFDAILVDSTDPLGGPGENLFGPGFVDSLPGCLKPHGVVVRHLGVPMLGMEELGQRAAQMRAALGHVQVYRAAVPTYIGGDMAFAVSSLAGEDCSRPNRAHRGKYYNPDIHRAAFTLPTCWDETVNKRRGKNSGIGGAG